MDNESDIDMEEEDEEIIDSDNGWETEDDTDDDTDVDDSDIDDADVNHDAAVAPATMCDVCLVCPRDRLVVIPCGHATFCATCLTRLRISVGNVGRRAKCPACRGLVTAVIPLFI